MSERKSNNINSVGVHFEEIKKLDINLNRLIHSCENLIATTSNGKDIITVERYIPVLFNKLKQLKDLIENKSTTISNVNTQTTKQQQQQQSNIINGGEDDKSKQVTYQIPTKEVLNEYTRKIDVIFGLVNQEKLNSPVTNKLSMIRLQSSYIPHSQKMNEVHTVLKIKNNEEKKKTQQLLSVTPSQQQQLVEESLKSGKSPSLQFRNTFQSRNNELNDLLGKNRSSIEDQDQLDQMSLNDITEEQRKIQSDYTMDLLAYSRSLKDQSLAMKVKLDGDQVKLGELSSIVDNNQSKIDGQNSRLKEYTSQSSRDTLNYFFILVVVIFVFFATYFFMKFNTKIK